MRVVVTGGRGKVGRFAVEALQAAGHDVVAVDLSPPEFDLPGHEVMYIASPDNSTGPPFAELVRSSYGDAVELRSTPREDASGIDCAKAHRLLGWRPIRSWRDYLDAHGRLRPQVTVPDR